ncbi:nose resistant to fluoxetine protein 6 [Biomphalaria pfeifferi]|uniref:Nose resistant to fluoxetine protein 6 n=1 Tax=Biomphalaria pfeifferi TaxID=112525 RepID=A0AAD8F7Z8_BIOPF|nr:nose resistant to fluoxetine protein 6 [Biomphalaria pfeifferi]
MISRTRSRNMLAAVLTVHALLTNIVNIAADDTFGSRDSNTFLGGLNTINGALERQKNPEYQETLKNFESLLSDKNLLGQSGIIGSSFLVTPGNGSKNSSNTLETDGNGTKRLQGRTFNAGNSVAGNVRLRSQRLKADNANQSKCLTDIERLINDVRKDAWVLPFLDAWGKPGPSILLGRLNFVGNYRQCRSAKAPPLSGDAGSGFTGQYCVLNLLSLNFSASVVSAMSGLATLQIGSCVPDSCSQDELTILVELGLIMLNASKTFVALPTECRTDDREYTSASIAAIVILSILLALMILGTLFDLIVIQWPKWATKFQGEDSPDYIGARGFMPRTRYHPIPDEERTTDDHSSPSDEQTARNGEVRSHGGQISKGGPESEFVNETKPLLGKKKADPESRSGILSQILLSFSVYTNASKVLNTSQPPGSLSAINGIRCLSMSWVVLGHMYVFGLTSVVNTAEELPLYMKRWTFDAISNALVSVDTFFTLSGLLVAYLTTKEMSKKGWKINWGLFYFHRFWRLTPPYMMVLVIGLGLQRFMGSGALWATVQPVDKSNCEDNWWTNLLYVNNLVNKDKMCLGHSWYLANDMQFYVLSPLMLIPFVFHRYAGVISCSIFILAQWVTAGVLSSDNGWTTTLLGMNVKSEPGSLNYFSYYYIAPYCRIGPYVVGILAGYLLAVGNGRVRMDKLTVFVGWLVSTASALAVVYGLRGDISGENPSSVAVAALYNAVARSAWGVCVCWVVIACVSGYGGPVNVLLSWSPFVALSRLTYMAYLIHPTVMYIYFGNQETLYTLNDTNIVISYLGILLFTYLASFVLMLAIESPMIGLEKALLPKKRH